MDTAIVSAPRVGLSLELRFEDGVLRAATFRDLAPPSPPRDPRAQPWAALVARHLETGREDLSAIPVELGAVPAFDRAALEALRKVRAGATITYGELAARMGAPGGAAGEAEDPDERRKRSLKARAAGGAMARNPIPVVVPCHRVLPATGELGNYSGRGGTATKLALLQLEGARF